MICNNCGKVNADGAIFCAECGNRLEEPVAEIERTISENPTSAAEEIAAPTEEAPQAESATLPMQEMHTSDAQPQQFPVSSYGMLLQGKKKSKVAIIIAIIVAAVIVFGGVVFGIFALTSTGSMERPLEYLCEAVNERDVDSMVKTYPKPMQRALNDTPVLKKYLERAFIEEIEDEEIIKISYDVVGKRKLTEDEYEDELYYIEEGMQSFKTTYSMMSDKEIGDMEVKEIYELQVSFVFICEDDIDTDTDTFIVFKTDDGWYSMGMDFFF